MINYLWRIDDVESISSVIMKVSLSVEIDWYLATLSNGGSSCIASEMLTIMIL